MIARAAACACIVLASVAVAQAQTLQDALVQAYTDNPELAAERQRLRAQDESVPRALSGWRPHVTIDAYGGKSILDDNQAPGEPQWRVPESATLTVTQPLYQGGQVRAQVAQAEALVRAERAMLAATESQVLLAAATAYLDVALGLRTVGLDQDRVDLLSRTLRATLQQVSAGDVTETDAAQSEARLADGRATLAAAQSQLDAAREAYRRTVGAPAGAFAMPALAGSWPAALPRSRSVALSLAEADNFEVVAARYAEAASRAGIDIARAGLLPHVLLRGALERLKNTDLQTYRQRDNIAEGTVVLSVPIYQGGAVAAETRQAHENAARSLLERDVQLRAAHEQAADAWDALLAARERVAQERLSVAANQVALHGITHQQSVRARTTLDVLNAQVELFTAQVAEVSAERDLALGTLQLLSATGRLTARALALPVTPYDPRRHYRAVRDKWWGTKPAP